MKWLTFDEVLKNYGMAEFEVIEAFKEGLSPYHRQTGEVLPCDGFFLSKGLVLDQSWHFVVATWKASSLDEYIIRAFKSDRVVWRINDVDAYIKGQDHTPASTITVNYSKKTKEELKAIAESWRVDGMTRQQIAKRLYSHDIDTVKIETLKKRVDRLFS